MKYTLVGNTGLVGRNLAASHSFDGLYHKANIEESFGADNGLVVYSGLPCDELAANADPNADFARAEQALENIQKMKPEGLVLISTTQVYARSAGVYEDTRPEAQKAHAYGKNRYALESWVRAAYPEALIVRLPDLFGDGLDRNFIYDMLMPVPSTLDKNRFHELAVKEPLVESCYSPGVGGLYHLEADPGQREGLKAFFAGNSHNALNRTDSRAVFQFYDLANLWADIQRCLKLGLTLANFATEPVVAGALYHFLFGETFENPLDGPPPRYDVRTHYGREFGGHDDYIADRTEVVSGIAKYVGRVMADGGSP